MNVEVTQSDVWLKCGSAGRFLAEDTIDFDRTESVGNQHGVTDQNILTVCKRVAFIILENDGPARFVFGKPSELVSRTPNEVASEIDQVGIDRGADSWRLRET